ncbi:MAG: Lrp/AsnC family transcriptional regulator [Gemmatimonadota bacterium]|nr:Lrp/AsnC family transcriptional regulator [Gemmatimonadota bacterium]
MDGIDVRLVSLLQGSGRISQNELAQAVGLSAPAVAERIRKLEDRGVIRRYAAIVDPRALGLDVTAFIAVVVSGSKHFPVFAQRVSERSEVLECHSVTGQGSHLLKVRTDTTSSLERLLSDIQGWPGVQSTMTSVVLSTTKESVGAPLEEMSREMLERENREDSGAPAAWLHVPFRHNP